MTKTNYGPDGTIDFTREEIEALRTKVENLIWDKLPQLKNEKKWLQILRLIFSIVLLAACDAHYNFIYVDGYVWPMDRWWNLGALLPKYSHYK